jgi:hypothetical protein
MSDYKCIIPSKLSRTVLDDNKYYIEKVFNNEYCDFRDIFRINYEDGFYKFENISDIVEATIIADKLDEKIIETIFAKHLKRKFIEHCNKYVRYNI